MEGGFDPRLVDGTALAPVEVARRVRRGELIVVRGCLQRLGLLDRLRGDALAALAAVVGEPRARRIEAIGLEKLHCDMCGSEIVAWAEGLTMRMRSGGTPLAARVLEGALGRHALLFFEDGARARVHVPYHRRPTARDGVAALVERIGPGAVTPHGLHRDGWFGLPTNSLDVWIALGRVREGNGLSVFPEALDRRIGRDADGRLAAGQGFGRPVNVRLEAGDAFVFKGDHLHASELNRTDETRVVVSYRAVIGVPAYVTAPAFRFRYAGPLRGWFGGALTMAAALQWHTLRAVRRARGPKPSRRLVGEPGLRLPEPLGADPQLDTSVLPLGSIRALDERTCAVALEDGRIVRFARSCPHEGGDLAAATLRDGWIVCPRHGTPFDAATGRSACPGVPALSVEVLMS